MAAYTNSFSPVKRSEGQSSVASAAYVTASKLIDRRTGEIHDYTRKRGVICSEMVLPKGSPAWSREELWNQVEKSETRKNAQTALKNIVSLPHELSQDQMKLTLRRYATELSETHCVAVDWSLHAPDRKSDERNYHGHLEISTRRLEDAVFTEKAREFSNRDEKNIITSDVKTWTGSQTISHWREQWATHCNRALESAGLKVRVDHRSYKEQGIDKVPQKHLGKAANAMERRGYKTDLGNHNRKVIGLAEVREKHKQADNDLKIVNQNIKAIMAVVIDLQAEGEKRRQNLIKKHIEENLKVESENPGNEAESSGFISPPFKPKMSQAFPTVAQFNLIDKLTEDLKNLQQQWSAINQQVQELDQLIPSTDDKKAYRDKAITIICPHKADYSSLKHHLQQQWSKLEVSNFYWSSKGDKEGWSLDSVRPAFLKSSARKKWEARGKELVKIKEQLVQQIAINNKHLHDDTNYLRSTQGKHAFETARDNLINADFPCWSIATDQKDQMEIQLNSLWKEKSELEKLRNDLNTYFPSLNIEVFENEDIRKRVRQPDILHLIRIIEQIRAKELTRKRHKEMSLGRG